MIRLNPSAEGQSAILALHCALSPSLRRFAKALSETEGDRDTIPQKDHGGMEG